MISRKVLSQSFATFVVAVVSFALTRQGIHVSPAIAAEVSGVAGWVGGMAAGWLAKEEPWLVGGNPVPPVPAPGPPVPATVVSEGTPHPVPAAPQESP